MCIRDSFGCCLSTAFGAPPLRTGLPLTNFRCPPAGGRLWKPAPALGFALGRCCCLLRKAPACFASLSAYTAPTERTAEATSTFKFTESIGSFCAFSRTSWIAPQTLSTHSSGGAAPAFAPTKLIFPPGSGGGGRSLQKFCTAAVNW